MPLLILSISMAHGFWGHIKHTANQVTDKKRTFIVVHDYFMVSVTRKVLFFVL